MQDRLLVAGAVLVAGVILALVVRAVVVRLLRRVLPAGQSDTAQLRAAARGAFWFLVLASALVALSLLSPGLLSGVPAQVISFLPKLAVALVIAWLGAVAASLLAQLVKASLSDVRVTSAAFLGRLTYWTVLGFALLMAADQLGVDTDVLQRLVFLLLLVAGAAAALALGIGGRTLAGNVVAGRYVDDRFTVGERIEVDEHRGSIVDVGLASVTIAEADGTLVEIPHAYLLSRPVRRSGV